MPDQPSVADRALDAGADSSTLPPARRNGRLTSSIWTRPSWTDSVAFAISISLRGALSESAVNFMGFVGCGDMGHVKRGVFRAVTVEGLAAGASDEGTGFLRRQPSAGFPHCIFPAGPIPLVAPRLKIAFRSVG